MFSVHHQILWSAHTVQQTHGPIQPGTSVYQGLLNIYLTMSLWVFYYVLHLFLEPVFPFSSSPYSFHLKTHHWFGPTIWNWVFSSWHSLPFVSLLACCLLVCLQTGFAVLGTQHLGSVSPSAYHASSPRQQWFWWRLDPHYQEVMLWNGLDLTSREPVCF